jgi:GGDEF domain-containing protein
MGSTNGTQLNGVDVHGEVAADPGDVIGVGPVLLRLEHATADDEARLAAITRLEATPDRDPLTRLLLSKHLHEHLPEALRPSFREGGEVPEGAPALWGVLLHVDRLTALHAQHGEQVADGVFAVASRLLQYAHTDPMAVTKVGYGEVLVPLVGGDEADTRATTKRLIDTVTDHPWQEPVRKVSLTAAIGRKEPEESASAWLGRIRAALQQGRTQKGRGQIY